jgi:hypothetical protein
VSKKTALSRLKPGADEFVAGQAKEPGATQPVRPAGRMVRLNVDLPESLHKRLKREALDRDTNIREFVIELLRRELQVSE